MPDAMSLLGAAGGGGMPSVSGSMKDELKSTATSTTTTKNDISQDKSGAAGNRGFVFTFNSGSGGVDAQGVGQGVNPLVKGSTTIWLIIGGVGVVALIVFYFVRRS